MVDLQKNLDQIHALNAEVIGVSNSANVPLMVTRFGISYPMLTDADASVCQQYEVYDDLRQGVLPTTFVIDKQGVIQAKFREQLSDSVPVLEALQALNEQ